MKKISYMLIILAAVWLSFSSCEKIINKEPQKLISDAVALTTVEGLQSAVIGTYNALQNGDLYGGNIWACGDMIANNIKPSGEGNIVFEETQMLSQSMSPDNRLSASFWSNAYYAINMANSIIQAVPEVNPPADVANRILGECLFIRAMIYFDMVRYLGNPSNGLGVPLVTEPTGIEGKPARAESEAVYTQIISDLISAAEKLPASNNDRATSYAAKALLSTVYFYRGQWELCEQYASDVISSNKFALDTNVAANFTSKLTSEIIFAILSTETNTSAGTLNGYYRLASNGKFSPAPVIIKLFTFTGGTEDQRFNKFFINKDGKYFTTMFDDKFMNIPLMRLAEVYLNRAEARFNLGNTTGALEDLNMVRKRAGITDTVSINLTALYYERSKELVFQGDNFFNMKRLQKAISDQKLPWDDRRLLYLVPQREMDVNPNLVQN